MRLFKSSIVLLVAMFAAVSAFGQGQTIYNSIPAPLPGNVISLGYEATSTAEFGLNYFIIFTRQLKSEQGWKRKG